MYGEDSAAEPFEGELSPNALGELRAWRPKRVASWAICFLGFDNDDAKVLVERKISGVSLLSDAMTVERLLSAGLLDGPAVALFGAVEALKEHRSRILKVRLD